MMIEEFELSACRGKAALTRQLAQQVLKRSKRARKGTAKRAAYRCKACKQWHVGRITRSIPRSQRREWHHEADLDMEMRT